MGKLSKDRRDIYYRKAKENGYRARSSYKLIQINEKFEIFKLFNLNNYSNKDISDLIDIYNNRYCYNIVDLCAAPGSWSQVLKNICLYNYYQILHFLNKKNYEKSEYVEDEQFVKNFSLYINFNDALEEKIKNMNKYEAQVREPKMVAVDLQEIGNMGYVQIIQGDITKGSTIDRILKCMEGGNACNEGNARCRKDGVSYLDRKDCRVHYAHAVVSDGAPDITGMNDIDEFIQSQLILSSLKVCCSVLKIGGNFISKIFRGEHTGLLILHLNKFFERVYVCKPQSSRNKSLESFLVCLNFSLPLSNIIALDNHTEEQCPNYRKKTQRELREMHIQLIVNKDGDCKGGKRKGCMEKGGIGKKGESEENGECGLNRETGKISSTVGICTKGGDQRRESKTNDQGEGEYAEEEGDHCESEDSGKDAAENAEENASEGSGKYADGCPSDHTDKESSDEMSECENSFTPSEYKEKKIDMCVKNSGEKVHKGKDNNKKYINSCNEQNNEISVEGKITGKDEKRENLDIFNFYCSDSDEEIKYFNSEDEEIVNEYIASETFMNNKLFSFVATQNYYDSDKSYLLPQNYVRHEPQVMPLQPPYLLSLQKKRQEKKN
ncbi:ribosomal RNA methyltransferase, putative [Plasmodium ovale]|uniref:Putative tRNA (cytidine(32)/guanosine(34)-2'-O)-methyltransferase n=2 Tax=Plasmodium ovale TaxID=36330 RepID=A0A1A8VSR8_PLAOA|nr:ribosomal RNA methyltransferase, putative [Plasmodium ovale curtisi]SBS84907.1 ribosomal RNA methyltransferase, putative [Plasmodium ovale curtisi]SCQ16075.1 ribosomal RNA methyltransferase, putative [Plasmodium ovale]